MLRGYKLETCVKDLTEPQRVIELEFLREQLERRSDKKSGSRRHIKNGKEVKTYDFDGTVAEFARGVFANKFYARKEEIAYETDAMGKVKKLMARKANKKFGGR